MGQDPISCIPSTAVGRLRDERREKGLHPSYASALGAPTGDIEQMLAEIDSGRA